MDPAESPAQYVEQAHRVRRRGALAYIGLALVVATLTSALFITHAALSERDRANSRLAQFCRSPNTTDAQCAAEVAKQGDPGPQGDAGPRGPVGPPGADGEDGADGQDGQDGKRGPRGFTGLDGAQGPRGQAGAAGAPGADGRDGLDGKDGATGPAGPRGEPGPQGDPGVVAVDDQCNPPAGEMVTDVGATYVPGSQTVVLTCSSAPLLP